MRSACNDSNQHLWSAKREGPSLLRRGVAPPRLPSKDECGHSPSPPAELRELLRGWSVSAVPPLPLTAYSGRLRFKMGQVTGGAKTPLGDSCDRVPVHDEHENAWSCSVDTEDPQPCPQEQVPHPATLFCSDRPSKLL